MKNSAQLTAAIDAHLHFWDKEKFDYPWLDGIAELDRSFGPDDLDATDANVTGAVFVQADCRPSQSLEEVEWISNLVDPPIRILGIVAFAPLEVGKHVGQDLDRLAEFPLVRGVRRNLQNEPEGFFAGSNVIEGLRELNQRKFTFDACVRWNQLPLLIELIEAVPDVKVVLDHLGKPPVAAGIDSDDAQEWATSISKLAAFETVTVKISGMAPDAGKVDDLAATVTPFIDTVIERFGSIRCLIGSDWPVSSAIPESRPYRSWFQTVLDGIGLSKDERVDIANRSAQHVYALPHR